jgi:hypothetical protein
MCDSVAPSTLVLLVLDPTAQAPFIQKYMLCTLAQYQWCLARARSASIQW